MQKRKYICHTAFIALVPLLLLLLFNGIYRYIAYELGQAGDVSDIGTISIFNYVMKVVQFMLFGLFSYYISTLRFQKGFTIPFAITITYLALIVVFFPITPIVWRNFESSTIPALLLAVYAAKLGFALRRRSRWDE